MKRIGEMPNLPALQTWEAKGHVLLGALFWQHILFSGHMCRAVQEGCSNAPSSEADFTS